jgi:hypothetical protein
MVRFFFPDTNVATIVSPQDLVPDGDPAIEHVLYQRLEEIAITDLDFDTARHDIVFSDPDGTDYIVRNDRNLRTALSSIHQAVRHNADQKGVFKMLLKSGR